MTGSCGPCRAASKVCHSRRRGKPVSSGPRPNCSHPFSASWCSWRTPSEPETALALRCCLVSGLRPKPLAWGVETAKKNDFTPSTHTASQPPRQRPYIHSFSAAGELAVQVFAGWLAGAESGSDVVAVRASVYTATHFGAEARLAPGRRRRGKALPSASARVSVSKLSLFSYPQRLQLSGTAPAAPTYRRPVPTTTASAAAVCRPQLGKQGKKRDRLGRPF